MEAVKTSERLDHVALAVDGNDTRPGGVVEIGKQKVRQPAVEIQPGNVPAPQVNLEGVPGVGMVMRQFAQRSEVEVRGRGAPDDLGTPAVKRVPPPPPPL